MKLSESGEMSLDSAQLRQFSTERLIHLIIEAEQIIQSRLRTGLHQPEGQNEWEFVSEHAGAAPGLDRPPPDPAVTSRAQAAGYYRTEELLVPFICPYRCAFCQERCTRNRPEHSHHRCYCHRRR